MNRMESRFLSLLLAFFLFLPVCSNACSVCMGASDSPVASAMNAAIFLMLGFVGLMLCSIGGFIFYLSRRSPLLPSPFNPISSSAQEEK